MNWVLIIAIGALILIPSGLSLILKNSQNLWAVTLACIAAVLLIRLPDIELFKVGPMEARLRRATESAEASVQQLQQVAIALAKPVLGSLPDPRPNRDFVGRRTNRLEARSEVVAALAALGVSKDQMKEATASFDAKTADDIYYDTEREAQNHRSTDPALSTTQAQEINLCFSRPVHLAEPQLRSCVAAVIPVTGDLLESFEDLSDIEQKQALRRPEAYLRTPY